jgi:uncharacterized delta-60 repeat protein
VIIGGEFTTVKGLVRFKVARLNADGSGDDTFNPGASLAELSNGDWYVTSVVLQPDGKVLIGGFFIVAGFNGIARLNADGSLDSSFNPTGAWGASAIALQPDGKVIVDSARLNTNGTLDNSFISPIGNGVRSVALQPDGKVLVGGYLFHADASHYGIARLNANGSPDGSFNPGTGANATVTSIAVQSDGKVLIGGWFTEVNGTNRDGIARLNADGSLDGSFNPFNPPLFLSS